MANDQRYADLLRTIGRILDEEDARTVRVAEDARYVTVSWANETGRWESRAYQKGGEVERLRVESRRTRGAGAANPAAGWEERLRTLGQELDADGITLTKLAEAGGFEITGQVGDKPVGRWYSLDELGKKSSSRRAGRQAPSRMAIPWWRRMFPGARGRAQPRS